MDERTTYNNPQESAMHAGAAYTFALFLFETN